MTGFYTYPEHTPSRWKYGLVAVLAVLGISTAASYYAGATHSLIAQPKTTQSATVEEQVKGAQAPTETPEPTEEPEVQGDQATYDPDPIVSCGPGANSGQYVKDKSSNCKNYVDCGLNNNTVWTMMLKSTCDSKHAEQSANSGNKNTQVQNRPPSGSNYITIPCSTVFGANFGYGLNQGEAESNCRDIQARARVSKSAFVR